MEALLGLLICPVIAVIPAWIARRKGRSAWGFYLFGLCCFLPGLITALIISEDPAGIEQQRQRLKAGRAPSDSRSLAQFPATTTAQEEG